jgi:hypothetical protein
MKALCLLSLLMAAPLISANPHKHKQLASAEVDLNNVGRENFHLLNKHHFDHIMHMGQKNQRMSIKLKERLRQKEAKKRHLKELVQLAETEPSKNETI